MPDIISAVSNFAIAVPAILSVAKFDVPCRGWADADRAADNLPLPKQINGASDVERSYLNQHGKDAKVVLFPADYLTQSDESDHRKHSGWAYWLCGCNASGEACRVAFDRQAKAEFIAAVQSAVCSASPKILLRSGDIVLIVPRVRADPGGFRKI